MRGKGKDSGYSKDESEIMKEAMKLEEDVLERLCPECKVVLHETVEELNRCLEERIEERKKVEKAKWILIEKRGIGEEEAHKLLMTSARQQRKKLGELATAVIDSEKLLDKEAVFGQLSKDKNR